MSDQISTVEQEVAGSFAELARDGQPVFNLLRTAGLASRLDLRRYVK